MINYHVSRNPYALFVMDNVNSARMAESNRLDVKKLGEMWKELDKSEKDVSRV